MRNGTDGCSPAEPSKSPVFPLETRSWDSAETRCGRGGGALTGARCATPAPAGGVLGTAGRAAALGGPQAPKLTLPSEAPTGLSHAGHLKRLLVTRRPRGPSGLSDS